MRILGTDTETTGFLADDHRIIEVYFGLYEDEKKIWEYETRINPERNIPADSQRVHGISAQDVIGKPLFKEIAPIVEKVMNTADLVVAHNGDDFDRPFFEMEMKRNGFTLPPVPWFDTMKQGIWATPIGKSPRLEELCFACGIDYDPAEAHAAEYDVRKMMECYFVGQKTGFYGEE